MGRPELWPAAIILGTADRVLTEVSALSFPRAGSELTSYSSGRASRPSGAWFSSRELEAVGIGEALPRRRSAHPLGAALELNRHAQRIPYQRAPEAAEDAVSLGG